LIRPSPGRALAYVDWSQQEFGIAAALSGDTTMQAAYTSGDPYLAFARQAGAVPVDATKGTHGPTRERYKQCALAVQYGMGAESLGDRIDQPTAVARALLRTHRAVYRRFWSWSDAALDYAHLHGRLFTTFGWPLYVDAEARAPALRNYPMQGNGAELLRLACILATEAGVQVVAPVHDALLIEADTKIIDDAVALTQAAMLEASRAVLAGFELRSEAKTLHYPDRYADPRGAVMWATVNEALDELTERGTCHTDAQVPVTQAHTTCHTDAHPPISLSLISLVSLSSCSLDKRDSSFNLSGDLGS
jgi:DNA polymerase I-like protein with 3'-5' exonuclease and polymerase domains